MRIAYYQQLQQESLPYDLSPLQHLTNVAPEGFNEQSLRAHLGSFGLAGDLALQQIGVLSGGQKSRVCACGMYWLVSYRIVLTDCYHL